MAAGGAIFKDVTVSSRISFNDTHPRRYVSRRGPSSARLREAKTMREISAETLETDIDYLIDPEDTTPRGRNARAS